MNKKMKWAGILNILCGSFLILPELLFVGLLVFSMFFGPDGGGKIVVFLLLIFALIGLIVVSPLLFAPIFMIIVGRALCSKKPKKPSLRTSLIITIILKSLIIASMILSDLGVLISPYPEEVLTTMIPTITSIIITSIPMLALFVTSIILDRLVLPAKIKKEPKLKESKGYWSEEKTTDEPFYLEGE